MCSYILQFTETGDLGAAGAAAAKLVVKEHNLGIANVTGIGMILFMESVVKVTSLKRGIATQDLVQV